MNLVCQAQAAEKNQVATQKMSSPSEEKLIILLQAMNNFDEINNFFMTNYQNKIRDLREAHMKSLNEMEELKRFQGSTFDEFSRRKLIVETLSLNSQPRFRNYRMMLIVWMIREFLKMLNQYAVDNPTLPVNLRFFQPFRDPGGMLSRPLGMPSRNDRPPSIWDAHGIPGNVPANPTACSSSPYPQESNPWISDVSEHTSPHVLSECQTPNTALDQRCQSGPSAHP